MAVIQNDKRRKELDRLYKKPSLQLHPSKTKRSVDLSVDFLSAYHPVLVHDAVLSVVTLFLLMAVQFGLSRFLR